jgi:protein O-mannosyl-transferase
MKKRVESKAVRNTKSRAKQSSQTAASYEPRLSARSRNQMVLLSIALICGVSVIYSSTVTHPFADYDDDNYVTANTEVQSGLTGHSCLWALTATEKSNWHPLTWISHELDFELYGLNPAGHHLTSIVLHVLNVVLLFLVVSFATRAPARSFTLALLFAVHPLNVESVVWIAERKNVLSTFFFLSALGCYFFYAAKPSLRRYLIVTLMFAFAVASKPMVITLPFVLLLMDYWPLQRVLRRTNPPTMFSVHQQSWSSLWWEKVPLFGICAGSALLTLYAQASGGSIKSVTEFPFGMRLRTAVWAYGEYLWKILWPVNLAPHYPHPGNTLAPWRVVLALVIVTLITVLAVKRSHSQHLLIGWCWFLGTLVPVIGLVQVGNQAIADRYVYLPIIGVLIAMVWAAADLLQPLGHGKATALTVAAIVCIGLSWRTVKQIGYWKSPVELWSHTLQVTQNNSVAENNLGVALIALEQYSEALTHFQNAERIDRTDPSSRLNIAAMLEASGKLDEALREYIDVIRLASGSADATANSKILATAYADLGMLYGELGQPEKARDSLRHALAINPSALNGMIGRYYQYLSEHPSAMRYTQLGEMLEQAGRQAEASAAYEKALQLESAQNKH